MSRDKTAGEAGSGKKKGKRGKAGQHHHHYYFYPAGTVPPAPVEAPPPAMDEPEARKRKELACTAQPPAPPAGRSRGVQEHHHHLGDNELIKGMLVGAGASYLLTNETVQKNLIRTIVRLWSVAQGGVEEVKERFRDAEAELKATADKAG